MKLHKKKRVKITTLKRKADKVFSLWIRERDKNICITCGREGNQNGHYVSRSWMNLRYDEKNCNCQCVVCNVFKNGNMDEYALALKRKYGPDILEELNARKVIKPYDARFLEEIIKKYAGDN